MLVLVDSGVTEQLRLPKPKELSDHLIVNCEWNIRFSFSHLCRCVMGKYLSTSLKEITAPCWRETVLNQLLASYTALWQSLASVSGRVNVCLLTVNEEETANNIPCYDRPQGTLPVV